MGLFGKRTPDKSDINEKDSLIEEIYGKLTEKEISEIEKNAELLDAYENMRRRVRRKRFFRGAVTIFFLLVLTFGVVLAGYKVLFRISEIDVVGDTPYTAEEICAGAGVSIGDGLYSFSSVKAGERLSANLPYIGELKVDRHIPNKITFTVKYEEAEYYTEIYGKIYLMSKSLRVVGEASDTDTENLTRLRLPGVKEVRFGFVPILRDSGAQKRMVSITDITGKSAMCERITQIDLRSSYELKMVSDGKHLLYMGDYTEVDTKLMIAETVLRDEMFKGENKARLDLSELSKTTVLMDNKLDFDE